ncbi:MAG: hypothetical protein H0U76_02030 [Ktedonobacteraceae bacterium]|nr:hypothetical protein [Ktedonobacteraceae bacterium]
MAGKTTTAKKHQARIDPPDGGRVALGGFIYQFVALAGMIAWPEACEDNTETENQVSTLLRLTRVLQPEIFDEDGFLQWLEETGLGTHLKQGAFIQLKFSGDGIGSTIGPQEFESICTSFRKSTGKAKAAGIRIAKWILLTNRRLGPKTQKNRSEQETKYSQTQVNPRSAAQSNERQLIIHSELSTTLWDDALLRFGHRYGLTPTEIEVGMGRLLGKMLRDIHPSGAPNITKTYIAQAFTGEQDPRPLTLGEVMPFCQRELERQQHRILSLNHKILRRNILDAITTAIQDHAVLLICGHGGSGKSVALWQWLSELGRQQPLQAAVAFRERSALNLGHRNIVAQIVNDWAGTEQGSRRREETIERTLSRLVIANPGHTPPILILGIDGIDEEKALASPGALDALIRPFLEENRRLLLKEDTPCLGAKLILVCRDQVHFDMLVTPSSGYPLPALERPPEITVTDFSSEELVEFVQEYFSPALAARFQLNLQDMVGSGTPTANFFSDAPSQRTLSPFMNAHSALDLNATPVDDEVFRALCHPALWHPFVELETEEEKHLFLNGDPALLRVVAGKFAHRIVAKADMRQSQRLGLGVPQIWQIFHNVASYTKSLTQTVHARQDWVTYTCTHHQFSGSQADVLYDEAISAGMIQVQAQQWEWRHSFVQSYFADTPTYRDHKEGGR